MSYYIGHKFNVKQDECLINMTLLLEGTDFLFKAKYNRNTSMCGKEYMRTLGVNFNGLRFFLQAEQNIDFTGLTYEKTFTIPGFALGDDIDFNINCDGAQDCRGVQDVLDQYLRQPNMSFIIQLVYLLDGEPQFRTNYVPTILTRPHYDLIAYMGQSSICFSYQPASDGLSNITLNFPHFQFVALFYADMAQTLYCQRYTDEQ